MDIIYKINELKKLRAGLIELTRSLSNQQLTQIPSGYSNNILWHFGHMLVTPIHHFYPGGNKSVSHIEKYYKSFLKGTVPDSNIDPAEINEIISLLIPSLELMETDFSRDSIQSEQTIKTSPIDQLLDFFIFHERIHASRILELMRTVDRKL